MPPFGNGACNPEDVISIGRLLVRVDFRSGVFTLLSFAEPGEFPQAWLKQSMRLSATSEAGETKNARGLVF